MRTPDFLRYLATLFIALATTQAQENPILEADEGIEARAEGLARYSAGLIAQLQGDENNAFENFLVSAEEDPTNAELVLEVAQGLLLRGETERALKLLDRSVQSNETNSSLQLMRALALERLQRNEEASDAYSTAWELDPENTPALANVLRLRMEKKDWDGFYDVLAKAAERGENTLPFQIQIARLALEFSNAPELPESERARAIGSGILDRLLQQEELPPEILIQAGELCEIPLGLQDMKKATEFYERARVAAPEFPGLDVKLTLLYVQLDDRTKAKEEAEKLVEQNPPNPFGFRALGWIAQAEEDYAEAAAQFERALELDPSESSFIELAIAYLNIESPEKALETLERAGARFEPSFSLYFYRGVAQLQNEDYESAFYLLEDAGRIAKAREPERLTAFYYFRLGTTAERIKDYDACTENLSKAIELDPDFHEAMNYLGYTWADNHERLDEALALVEKALTYEPENEAYLDSLAWIYYRTSKFEPALDAMKRAIANATEEDPIMFDHLGDIQAALGDAAAAREAWEKAVEIGGEAELIEAIEAKLRDNPLPDTEETEPQDAPEEEPSPGDSEQG